MKLAVVTGEASGDLHAAEVIRELRKLDRSLTAFGIGGASLRAAGVEVTHDIRDLAVVGLFNVVRHLPMYRRVLREITARIGRERPDAVLLVDFPDFNLRIAARSKALGLRVVYYISPQVWAWRTSRVHQIARTVDEMLVILPFEEAFYRDHGVPVTYVGHPLVEQLSGLKEEGRNTPNNPPRIALMPGSRKHEIDALLSTMLDAVREIARERAVDAYIIQAPTIERRDLDAIVAASGITMTVVNDGREALANADVAICASGTATLEAAILGVPSIVTYRLSGLTYLLARRLVKLPHFSLVNIVAGKKVVPELLQHQVTSGAIARETRRLLDPEEFARVKRELADVAARLGAPGASRRAAEKIYRLMNEGRKHHNDE